MKFEEMHPVPILLAHKKKINKKKQTKKGNLRTSAPTRF